jgi:HSP20 family molecular chaperone IbpA
VQVTLGQVQDRALVLEASVSFIKTHTTTTMMQSPVLHRVFLQSVPNAMVAMGLRPAAPLYLAQLCARSLSTDAHVVHLREAQRDEELIHKSYSDSFDESDSIEAGKKISPQNVTPEHPTDALFQRPGGFFTRPFADFDEFLKHPFFSMKYSSNTNLTGGLDRMVHSFKSPRQFPTPGSHIREEDGCYKICIRVPQGFTPEDMEIAQKHNFLHISGSKDTADTHGTVSSTRFDKRFLLQPSMDRDNLRANLFDDVLVVQAPKLAQREETQRKTVTITQAPHDKSYNEIIDSEYSSQFDESDAVEAGKT